MLQGCTAEHLAGDSGPVGEGDWVVGADEVVVGNDGFADRVRELSGGEGAAAVYDGVGRDTFAARPTALRPTGRMVLYGAGSGQPEPLELQQLAAHG